MKRIVTAMMATMMATMMAGCAAVVMSAVPGLAAQTPQEPHHAATDTVKPPSGMEAKCQAMMAEREKMMTEMKAADQRLDETDKRHEALSGRDGGF